MYEIRNKENIIWATGIRDYRESMRLIKKANQVNPMGKPYSVYRIMRNGDVIKMGE